MACQAHIAAISVGTEAHGSSSENSFSVMDELRLKDFWLRAEERCPLFGCVSYLMPDAKLSWGVCVCLSYHDIMSLYFCLLCGQLFTLQLQTAEETERERCFERFCWTVWVFRHAVLSFISFFFESKISGGEWFKRDFNHFIRRSINIRKCMLPFWRTAKMWCKNRHKQRNTKNTQT